MRRRDEDDEDLTPFGRVLRDQRRPHKIVDFPGSKPVPVALLVPTDEEIIESQAAALHYLKSLNLDALQLAVSLEQNLYKAEEERQILARVLRDPADVEASFATADELRRGFTSDMRRIVMDALAAFMDEQNLGSRKTGEPDPEKVLAMARDIKAGPEELSDWWMSLDGDTQRSTGLFAVAQLLTPPPPSSSGI